MHSKFVRWCIGLALVVSVGGTVFVMSRVPNVTESPPQVSETGKAYTLADIGTHSTAASCWTTINASVYDLTDWVGKHPGGERAILSICGKDGTAPFNAQHGGAALQQQILFQ